MEGMKRPLIAATLVLAALLLAAVLLLPRLARVERYRGRIEAAIEEKTGLRASLGSMHLALLPRPTLRIAPVSLVDPATGTRLEKADLAVHAELGPLFRGRLAVRRITVLHPRLVLARTRDGLALPALPAGAPPPEAANPGGPGVTVAVVRVRDGSILIPTGRGGPPWRLVGVDAEVALTAGTIEGRAEPAGGGTVRWRGRIGEAVRLDLDGVKTEALAPLLPAGLLRPGGTLAGTVTVAPGGTVTGSLAGRRIALFDGPRPLPAIKAAFTIAASTRGVRLKRLELDGGGVKMTGSGALAPAFGVTLKITGAPVAPAVAAARAVFPFPIDLRGPGVLSAVLRLAAPPGRGLAMSASGSISAGLVSLAGDLPSLSSARADFRLAPNGRLVLRPLEAVVAGGRLAARVTLRPVAPPGVLRLRGTLSGVDVAALLAAFPAAAGAKVSGRADAEADVTVDLGLKTLDVRALGGRISLLTRDLEVPGLGLMCDLRAAAGGGSLLGAVAGLAGGSRRGSGSEGGGGTARETIREARARIDLGAIPWKLDGIRVVTEDLTATGSGTLDPVGRMVELELRARLGAAASRDLVGRVSALGRLRDSRGRLVVPLTVKGPPAAPKVSFDLAAALAGRPAAGGKKRGPRTRLIEGLVQQLMKKKKKD